VQHDPRFDEVEEGQRVFRQLVDALSWPGKVGRLPPSRVEPPAPWSAALAQVARALLDAQVTFAVHGRGDEALTRYLAVNAGARPASPDEAEYVLVGRPTAGLDVAALRPGTALAPDQSTTLLVECEILLDAPSAGAAILTLRGRGVAGERRLAVDNGVADLLGRLAAREDEYPLGIDVVLVGRAGAVAALPRTTSHRREVPAWAT
jgi:alpha-D-ribose 1-methylphosphonate 5-triphosphate synthase subunit PhnH